MISFSNLLTYFIKEQNPIKIITYANLDISDGKLYENLNFTNMGLTSPGFWWCKNHMKYHN